LSPVHRPDSPGTHTCTVVLEVTTHYSQHAPRTRLLSTTLEARSVIKSSPLFYDLSHFNTLPNITFCFSKITCSISSNLTAYSCGLKFRACWDVTPYILKDVHWRFGGSCRFHLDGRKLKPAVSYEIYAYSKIHGVTYQNTARLPSNILKEIVWNFCLLLWRYVYFLFSSTTLLIIQDLSPSLWTVNKTLLKVW